VHHSAGIISSERAIENSGNGNRKQKMEMENGNGQNLMQMNLRVIPLIKDHLLKTTSVQRPHSNSIPKMAKVYLMTTLLILPVYKDHLCVKTMTSVQRPHSN